VVGIAPLKISSPLGIRSLNFEVAEVRANLFEYGLQCAERVGEKRGMLRGKKLGKAFRKDG